MFTPKYVDDWEPLKHEKLTDEYSQQDSVQKKSLN